MASPHVAGAAALVLEKDPSASPATVAWTLTSLATANHVSDMPYLLLNSSLPEQVPGSVAVSALTGTPTRSSGGWTATATVSVRTVSTGAPASGVRVVGMWAPGSIGDCTTTVTGTCSIGLAVSSAVKAIQFSVTDLTGTNVVYDSGSNMATQIVISKR
jgi:hypothetical protein